MSNYQQDHPTAAMRDQTAPTAPLGTRPGLRVTPVMLAVTLSVVVLMLFTVLFLLTRGPDKAAAVAVQTKKATPPTAQVQEPTPSDQPSEQASSADPAPTGSPQFTKELEPCTMVDQSLIRKLTLFPDKSQIYKEECEWQSLPPGGGLPDNMSWQVKVYTKVFPDLASAQNQFIAQRQDSVLLAKSSTPASPAIGEASWTTLYTLDSGSGRGPTTATVGVRVSNAVIMVSYQRKVPQDPEGKLLKGAQEVAKAVADKLSTAG